jgi:hypothetical protein
VNRSASLEVLGRETTTDRSMPYRRRNSSAEERIEEEIVQKEVATIPRSEDPHHVQTSALLLRCSSNRLYSAVAPPSPSKGTFTIVVASVQSCSALLLNEPFEFICVEVQSLVQEMHNKPIWLHQCCFSPRERYCQVIRKKLIRKVKSEKKIRKKQIRKKI